MSDARSTDEGIARGSWHPSVDIYENKEQIVLEAELPV
jgi:HSP20 family molecular chaperone IbpA